MAVYPEVEGITAGRNFEGWWEACAAHNKGRHRADFENVGWEIAERRKVVVSDAGILSILVTESQR